MTHVSYEDPSSLRTLLACTIVVLLLLRRKNKQRSNPLMNDEPCQEFRGQTVLQIEAVHNLRKVRMYLNVLSLRSTS